MLLRGVPPSRVKVPGTFTYVPDNWVRRFNPLLVCAREKKKATGSGGVLEIGKKETRRFLVQTSP